MDVGANKDDNVATILEKIKTQDDLGGKLAVYTMFRMTHMHLINMINMHIQSKDPKLWEEIKKVYYPSFFDKIKKTFGF